MSVEKISPRHLHCQMPRALLCKAQTAIGDAASSPQEKDNHANWQVECKVFICISTIAEEV